MLKNFKNWLKDRRSFLLSWYTKDSQEDQEPERSLIELPDPIRQKILEGVSDLPSNPVEQKAITKALNETFELWRENPTNADNSIVILSSPIAAVSRILTETLEDWSKKQQVSLKMIPLKARPNDITNIKYKLEDYLQKLETEKEETEVLVIPNLSWCFLRSLYGLEGIEYLQSLLCDGSKKRFWIIGGGQVGWEYLNSVCSIGAYCGKVFLLPPISPEELGKWLEPILESLSIAYDEPSFDKQILDSDKEHKTHYFEKLAEVSQGVSTVAVQLFLKSIRYLDEEEEEEADSQAEQIIDKITDIADSSEQKFESKNLIAQVPELPELGDLESADQYILYSLLLHGDLTIHALAESLGDSDEEVQARIQLLRRRGIVEQKKGIYKINPIYYPNLKRNLANNNFIIEET